MSSVSHGPENTGDRPIAAKRSDAPFRAVIDMDLWVWSLADAQEVMRQLVHGGNGADGLEHHSSIVGGGSTVHHRIRSVEVSRV